MIDWYDKVPCHTTDPKANDRTNGRIYKIAYRTPKHAPLDLGKLPDEKLVELLMHPNDYFVRHARRLLQERGARPALSLDRAGDTPRRLRVLWAMHVTGGVKEDLLRHDDPYVRAWTVQLLLEDRRPSDATLKELGRMAREETSPLVRLYLASALQRIEPGKRWEILEGLASRPEEHAAMRCLAWYGVEPLAASEPARALGLAQKSRISRLLGYVVMRSAAADALDPIVDLLGRAENQQALEALTALLAALRSRRRMPMPKGWEAADAWLAKSPHLDVRFGAAALSIKFGLNSEAAMRALADAAKDGRLDLARRTFALDALVEARAPVALEALVGLLGDPRLRERAVRGLAGFDSPKVAEALLAAYAGLGPDERKMALSTLASRVSWAKSLLSEVRRGKIAPRELTADVVRQLRALEDEEVSMEVATLWGTVRSSPEEKRAEMARLKAMVNTSKRKPDLSAGRAMYTRTCMQCHALFGIGGTLGPDITGSNRADLDYLLENIVDPSALVPHEYRATEVRMKDKQVVLGIVAGTDEKSVTLKTATETLNVPRDEIAEMKESRLSIMPEDQLKGFTEDEVRDLLAYLASPSQVPVLADGNTVHRFFNGKDLSFWDGDPQLWKVEDGEIVGKTRGLGRNAFLLSHLVAGDFRLTCEVRLAPDGANSGIQFRSAPVSDGVKGYQADIGAGWWGKLYEEEGRGLLWDRPGDAHVRKEDWNLYEVVAVGSRIRTAINGKVCVDLEDPRGARRGVIALQIHSGGATEVRFRKLKLELADAAELKTVGK
jgi:putative heme-binding domain-containing protein